MSLNILYPKYPPHDDLTPRDMGGVTDLIYHHSAGSPEQSVLDIDAAHRGRDFVMIGYHFIIGPNGGLQIWQGRPLWAVPAATEGFNTISVAVCLLGNFQSDDAGYTGPPTPAQIQAAIDLGTYIHLQVPSIVRTRGHRDYMPDACPGDEFYEQLPAIKFGIHKQLGR